MVNEYLKNCVTLKFDRDVCIDCFNCLDVCPRNVFTDKNNILEVINRDLCIECGACVTNCPTDALFVDRGVGCASAIIYGILNKTAPSCDCNSKNKTGCC